MIKSILNAIASVVFPKPDHFALMVHHQREADFHGHAGRVWDHHYHMSRADFHADALNAERFAASQRKPKTRDTRHDVVLSMEDELRLCRSEK